MKQKIALLLASIMVFSPISVFAASDNSLSHSSIFVAEKTLFMERDGGPAGLLNLFPNSEDDEPDDNEIIENVVDGSDLRIKLRHDAEEGTVFKVRLDNAKWFFKNTRSETNPTVNQDSLHTFLKKYVEADSNDDTKFGTSFKINNKISSELRDAVLRQIGNGDDDNDGTYKSDSAFLPDASMPKSEKDFNSKGANAIKRSNEIRFSKNNQTSTYDLDKGIYFDSADTYIRYGGKDVKYVLTVSADGRTATILLHQEILADDDLIIPIVALSEEEGDCTLAVLGEGAISSTSKLKFGEAFSAKTDTSVKNKVVSKYQFALDTIEIKERVANSIQPGEIVLKAPYGYYFVDPEAKIKAETGGSDKYGTIMASEGLFFRDNRTIIRNKKDTNNYIFMTYGSSSSSTNKKDLKDEIVINTSNETTMGREGLGLIKSKKSSGVISIENIVLVAQDYAPEEKIYINVSGSGITEQDVEVAERKEYGTILEIAKNSKVTKLVNGRYFNGTSGKEFDRDHQTASVLFTENVVASWWARRESEFTLSEGAKFRRVNIAKESNFDHSGRTSGLNGQYLPTTEKINYVELTAKKLRITDLEIKRDKMASFEMDIWVSVESGREGNIELTVGKGADDEASIVIAEAISPITVDTKVTNIKIGYQWQSTADFVITETEAGTLKKDTTVNIFLDDAIAGSDGIAIASDFVTQVNRDSRLTFSKPTVNNGVISFYIERQSYGTPTSIKLSNIAVRADRTVPETNNRPYKIVIGGEAIAANYSSKITSIDPKFSIKGLGADYLNVTTPAETSNNQGGLSNIVKVQIGSKDVVIGKDGDTKTITMDTEAYISAASNSTMVPVRFVSQALGIPDEQVRWDKEKRTVTIYNGARIIQFKIGSAYIIINGVRDTMYSMDTPPIKVRAEIKDDRSFLPFRQLGNALDVEVIWDDTTKTAIYNGTPSQEGSTPSSVASAGTPTPTPTASSTSTTEGSSSTETASSSPSPSADNMVTIK